MKGLSPKASRNIDRRTIDTYGLPALVLMEEAALGLYESLVRGPGWEGGQVLILCGKGNNGGDGLALARILHNRGIDVRVLLGYPADVYQGEAQVQWGICRAMGLEVLEYGKDLILPRPYILVDALLGTGFQGVLEGVLLELVLLANRFHQEGTYVLSVDIPSGMDGATGAGNPLVEADRTVALGYAKIGELLSSGMGELYVRRLEFPVELEAGLDQGEILSYLMPWEAKDLLPLRPKDSHKGTFGKVGILGGSRSMSGAALLTGIAALKSGAGVVTVYLENPQMEVPDQPELILEGWGNLGAKELDVLVLGPGLGLKPGQGLLEGIRTFLKDFQGPVLIDADGLRLLGEGILSRKWIQGPLILTPHPGEGGSLLHRAQDPRNRLGEVRELSRTYEATVLLKGFRTLVALGDEVFVNRTGNPGMATAGSGDVLSGIIGGLLGQGLAPLDAAVLGAYVHGSAGDILAGRIGPEGLLAGDLALGVGLAFRRLRNQYKAEFNLDLLRIV